MTLRAENLKGNEDRRKLFTGTPDNASPFGGRQSKSAPVQLDACVDLTNFCRDTDSITMVVRRALSPAGVQPLLAGMRSSSGPRKAQDLFGDGGLRVRAAS